MKQAGEKIRKQRKTLCLTQRELAVMTNIDIGTIKAYELGTKKMKTKTIKKIADITNTDIFDWIDNNYYLREPIKAKTDKETTTNEGRETFVNMVMALFRSDKTMGILYTALLDMDEITVSSDDNSVDGIEISSFAQNLLIKVTQLKFRKCIKAKEGGKIARREK